MKKLLMGLFVLVASLVLVACNKTEEPKEETPAVVEAEYKLGMGVVVSTASSKNATADAAGNAQVDATVATVVTDKDGKIVACRIDVAQNKVAVSLTGEVTVPEKFESKMELGERYGMGGKPYSPDNNGDGKVLEWDVQTKEFEKYVVGKTGAEVAALETQEVNNHLISKDEALLTAGCTIQITDFMAAVAKACADEQGVTFKTAEAFTLGVAATTFDDGSYSFAATNEQGEELNKGEVLVYTDFAASVVVAGKIAASLNDAIQPKFTVSATGELTAAYTGTKRELKEAYGMGGKPYSPDANGDGKVEEWYVQSLAFSKHVVGMTGEQVANMETKTNSIGYQMTTDEDLLKAGCTIQITAIKAVVAKSVANAR